MRKRFTFLIAALMLLAMFASPLAMWGQAPSAGTFIIDFYDADKLSSTSGTGLTNTNYSAFVQVPTGLTVTNVVTSVSVTGTVRYGMNGGLTAGTGTAATADTHYVTFNIGSDYAVTKCTVYATEYEKGRWLLNGDGADSGSLGAKGAVIANVTDPLIWDNLEGLTALTFKKDNGANVNQKRLTIYRIVCEYSTGGGDTPSITLSETALTGFNYVQGAGPSASQSFKVSGTNLGDNITVSLDENSKYEMSEQDGDNWSSITSKTLTPTSGTVGEKTLYVRMKSGLTGNDITGTITAASADATLKTISLSGSVTPTHTATFSVNGATTSQVYAEGATITFPSDPAAINGMAFMGWVDEAISGTTTTAPTYVNTASATMGNSDVTYYAVFAELTPGTLGTITDELTRATTGVTSGSSTYSNWSGKRSNSNAVYAGNSAGGNDAIQLRTDNSNSGVVTTASGGKAKKVTISWDDHTTNDRVLNIYGKSSAYSDATNLYDSSKQGDMLGSITYGTDTELTISGDYEYIGMRSNSKAMYINKISIEWEAVGPDTYSNYCTTIVIATKEIIGYTNNTSGWYLIASPVYTTPGQVTNMLTDEDSAPYSFDLYRFNQATTSAEWENYHQHKSDFNIVPGQGYLYAKSTDTTLTFTGAPYNGNGVISLNYSEANSNSNMWGWNLIGNPFAVTANLPGGFSYCTLNENRDDLIPSTANTINAMEAIFVKATEEGQSVTFTKQSRNAEGTANAVMALNLSSNSNGLIDRTIVRFDEGSTLPKFMFNESHTKIYIPQNGEDYAVVCGETQGEMPVNFKASQDGQYTITVNSEGVEVGYLHLIDNIAGQDIDLLATPSYTFNAKGDDYESRFRLVFSANITNAEMGEDFAFFSNGQLVIANEGEATLQMIDVTGRVVATENINGTCSKTINAKAGVYVLRLVNGTDVKTQKIVIR